MRFKTSVVPVDDISGAPLAGAIPITQTLTVWMVPLWAMIAAGVLVVLIVGGLLWWAASASGRRRERRAAQASPSAPPIAEPADGGFYDPETKDSDA
ncbi:MAG: hypothetical protein ACXWGX_00685 [Usitatibacter sp.]